MAALTTTASQLMTHPHTNLILDKGQIFQKIKRMAFEMYEHNFEEQELVLSSIHDNGYTLAQMLAKELESISLLKVKLLRITLKENEPVQQLLELDLEENSIAGKNLVLVDDVLNTGKTLAYTLNAFLQHNPKKVEIATLVNRHHTLYPVTATYTGYSLATTLREHVTVVLEENEVAAYLH
ncbi:phosphoribosyltransferase family protein [Pontibacter silvestris]|uniref:Phosphoribosyltransferase family protein n=1 Tax=Pontibacter silvestris TaxID=2305183 RepID=A0ABW4WTS8_9BACT|nr:phosphoribosyltransferase family protein [Pontibacter silvestris]MCC9137272.1 phosphoribosyltransferase [Pontibacter silvestris]